MNVYEYTLADKYYKEFLDEKKEIILQGEIYKKELKNESYRLYLKNLFVNEGRLPQRALIYSDKEYAIGDVVVVKGQVTEKQAENEGGFDYKKYLKSQKIYGLIFAKNISLAEENRLPIKEILYQYKEKMIGFYQQILPGEEAGILSAMVWGDKTEMDGDAAELFRRAGLSHILAISGLHLSIVGLGLYGFLRRIRLSFLQSGILSGAMVYIYALITGAPISFIRAVGMLFLALLAEIIGRSYDMLSALSLIGIIMLTYNPFYIYNSGFIMSFMAVLGICIVALPIGNYYGKLVFLRWQYKHKEKLLDKFKMSQGEKISSLLISGASLVLFTYPVVAYYYSEIPAYVMFLNIMVMPFMGILLVSGLIGSILFIKSPLYISHYIIFYYEKICDIFSSFPGAMITIPKPEAGKFIIFYLDLIIFTVLFANPKRILKLEKRFKAGKEIKLISRQIHGGVMCFLSVMAILISMLLPGWNKNFQIDMLSVGQGDGIYIRSEEGVNFFIDGGSSSIENMDKDVLKPYLKARGVRKMDYWIISHLDLDHISGFMGLLAEGYRIDNVIMSKYVVKTDDYVEIKKLCKKNNTKLVLVETGDRIETKSMYMEAIFPYENEDGNTNENAKNDANANSLCMYLNYGDFQAIFTGDIGNKEEELIIKSKFYKNEIKEESIELLKAAHHGSKNSNSIEWLEAVMPETIIISAGKNNRYGHPSKETMERIRKLGIKSYCTIDTGRIRLEIDKKGRKKWDFFVPLCDDNISVATSH